MFEHIEIGSVWLNMDREVEVLGINMGNDRLITISYRYLMEKEVSWAYRDDFLINFKPRDELLIDFKPKTDIANERGRKDDSAKPRYSLLPTGTVNQVVQVLEVGAVKYSDGNWAHVPNARTRYYDAAMRHLDSWWQGDKTDDETGLHHLAHAVCCLLFLLWFDSNE